MEPCCVCGAYKSNLRCGRCGTKIYCSSECQKKDWPRHKLVCSTEVAYKRLCSRHRKERPVVDEDVTCFVCLEGGEGLVHCGCACRGYAGYAHASCVIPMLSRHCKTCRQLFSGEIKDVIYMENWRQSKSTSRELPAALILAKVFRENDDVKQALALVDGCLSRVSSEDLSLKFALYSEKAEICIKQNKINQAQMLSYQAVEGYRRLGNTAELMNPLQIYSRVLLKLDKKQEAIDAICEAFSESLKAYGEDNEATLYLGLQSSAIVVMYSQDRHAILKAETRCKQQLDICQRVFGDQHTITKRAQSAYSEIRDAVQHLPTPESKLQGRGNMPSPLPSR